MKKKIFFWLLARILTGLGEKISRNFWLKSENLLRLIDLQQDVTDFLLKTFSNRNILSYYLLLTYESEWHSPATFVQFSACSPNHHLMWGLNLPTVKNVSYMLAISRKKSLQRIGLNSIFGAQVSQLDLEMLHKKGKVLLCEYIIIWIFLKPSPSLSKDFTSHWFTLKNL